MTSCRQLTGLVKFYWNFLEELCFAADLLILSAFAFNLRFSSSGIFKECSHRLSVLATLAYHVVRLWCVPARVCGLH